MKKSRKGFKAFYYLRVGYIRYVALAVGIINVLTATYYLAIENVPLLKQVFPTFEIYIIFCLAIGIPIMVFTGWLHFKRIGTYAAESFVVWQSYIYNYKWLPGYHAEVFGPAYLAILRAQVKQAKGEKLTDNEISNMKKLEEKLEKLINGGYVGNPPKGAFK